MIKAFRDTLALLTLVVIIPTLWVFQGFGYLDMPGEVIGATIMGWSLVLTFYFRKKTEGE